MSDVEQQFPKGWRPDKTLTWAGPLPAPAAATASGFDFNPDQPRDDHGRWVSTGGAAGSKSLGATDEEKAAARERLTTVVAPAIQQALSDGKTSDKMFVDANGDYTPERMAQQDALLQKVYGEASAVPNDRQAVMLGGLPGSGKSSSLSEAGVDSANYLTLNPDDMRDEMLRAGMGVDVPGLEPRETVFLIHEEASSMTKQLADMAYADGKNVMWDTTMAPKPGDNPASGVESKLNALDAAGYTTQGLFVDTAPATAADRALGRYAGEIGNGDLGGRPITSSVGIADPPANATNEEVFNQVKDRFSTWSEYDNNGTALRLIASGGKSS